MRKIINLILELYGGLMIGILAHEYYHTLTIQHVTKICYETNTDALFAVYGYGGSVNEFVAYAITFFILIIVVFYAIYDLFSPA